MEKSNLVLSDAEIVRVILGATTPAEYNMYSASVIAIWRPRFEAAAAKAAWGVVDYMRKGMNVEQWLIDSGLSQFEESE